MNHSEFYEEERTIYRKNVEKSANIVKKKVKSKNTNLFKQIFRIDYLIKDLKSIFSINAISILFLFLILLHISLGYSLSTKRLLLFFSFIISLSLIYILYKLAFHDLLEENKYPAFTKIYPVFIIILFLTIVITIYRFILLPNFPKKYSYEFPI